MSEKDTNCDETNVENDGMGDRNAPDFELPDCCRPMVERMMKAFKSAPENETVSREGARNSDLPDWCKSMMIQMMRARGESREGDGESAAESPGSCCGEPK